MLDAGIAPDPGPLACICGYQLALAFEHSCFFTSLQTAGDCIDHSAHPARDDKLAVTDEEG